MHTETELVVYHVELELSNSVFVLEQVNFPHQKQQVVLVGQIDFGFELLEGLFKANEVFDLARHHKCLDNL